MEEAIKKAVSTIFSQEVLPSQGEVERKLNNLLLYYRWPVEDPDATIQTVLSKGLRQVCQYQFKKNDIVWICKQCQKDETCVLCNECFQDSEGKHEGHEVYFYHSQAGGCCDCGDEGAWDTDGFCNHHGKSNHDPLEFIPSDIQETGKVVMSECVQHLLRYSVGYCKSFNIGECDDSSGENESSSWNLLLHNDDIHTFDDVINALSALNEISREAADNIASKVHSEGHAVVGEEDSLSVVVDRARSILRECSLHVSIAKKNYIVQEQIVVTVISWFNRMAESNDGMSRLICESWSIDDIKDIFETDPRLPKKVAANLHHFFLTLMADQKFKVVCSKAYALAFSTVAQQYMNGVGTQEHCLFGLSVQFLNRSLYVDTMVYNYNFLSSVANSLLTNLKPTEGAFDTNVILQHRKYSPVLGDLKVVFTLPNISRYFCATCMDQILSVFSLFQYIHPQSRELIHHVEFEGRDWMHAFNLYLGFSSMFDFLVNWFGEESSTQTVNASSQSNHISSAVSLPTVVNTLKIITLAIQDWQKQKQNSDDASSNAALEWQCYSFYLDTPSSSDDTTPDVFTIPDASKKSFHIFLHRFLATAVRDACRYAHVTDSLIEFQQYLRSEFCRDGKPSSDLILLIDYPLRILAWESEIKADLWKRNGSIMMDQVLNYGEPPFCRIYRDLDITLLQLCACVYGINRLVNHIMKRFGLQDYLASKKKMLDVATGRLTESMLHLIITIVTELPLPGMEDKAKRVELLLRREVVHKLVGGMATYSELQECTGLVPESDKVNTSVLDDAIAQVSEWQTSHSALEPSKLKLKESAWSEYDPSFTHASNKVHQLALEMRPKKSNISKPMCPDFSHIPAHPAFEDVRLCTLIDPTLLSIVRNLFYAYHIERLPNMHDKAHSPGSCPDSSHPYYVVRSDWNLRCSAGVFSKTLHLFTLMVHNISPRKKEDQRIADSVAPSLDERRVLFEDFCLSDGMFEVSTNGNFEDVSSKEVIALPSLLSVVIDIYDSMPNVSDEDIVNKQSLLWIISKLESTLSSRCAEFISQRMKQELAEKRQLEMKEKREKARERAMSAMKRNASAFAEHMEKEGFHDSSDEEDEESEEQSSLNNYDSAPKCIICRSQRSDEPIGYLGLSQQGNFLSPDFREAKKELHVDADNDCERMSSLSKSDRVKKTICSDNTHLHVRFCGHAMHSGCFDLFIASVIERAGDYNELILDSSQGFFQCPFCRKLGNILLPQISHRDDDDDNKVQRGFDAFVNHSTDEWVDFMSSHQSLTGRKANGSDVNRSSSPLKRVHESLSSNSTLPPPNSRRHLLGEGESAHSASEDESIDVSDNRREEYFRSSAVRALMGLFRGITKYSRRRCSTSTAISSDGSNDSEEYDDNNDEDEEAMSEIDQDIIRQDQMFKQQSNWLRCLGDICNPILPSTKLATSIQHYELVPIRLSLALSGIAYSFEIDRLGNGNHFELALWQQLYEEDDQHMKEEPLSERYSLLFKAFSRNRRKKENSTQANNAQLLCLLVDGVQEYTRCLGITSALRRLVTNAIYCSNTGESCHWLTYVSFPDRIFNRGGLCEDSQPFSSQHVSRLWGNTSSSSNNDENASEEVFNNGDSLLSDWFSLPILAMPLTEVLVFLLVIDSKIGASPPVGSDTNSINNDNSETDLASLRFHLRWVTIAKLVQITAAMCTKMDIPTDFPSMEFNRIASLQKRFPILFSIMNRVSIKTCGSSLEVHRTEEHCAIIQSILHDWRLFIQSSLHLISRICPELAVSMAIGTYDSDFESLPKGGAVWNLDVTEESIRTHLVLSGLEVLMEDTREQSVHYNVILQAVDDWLDCFMGFPFDSVNTSILKSQADAESKSASTSQDIANSLSSFSASLARLRTVNSSYPCDHEKLPKLFQLPNSYTKLHGMVTAVCDFDYPAICMTCGTIIDAAGKGLCSKHCMDCASGVGIFFLLQDCTILLLDGIRGTYYATPYVDAHGEKHKSFRGKPLYIDTKRLWLSHTIPSEVASKRSTSTRVIINGHY